MWAINRDATAILFNHVWMYVVTYLILLPLILRVNEAIMAAEPGDQIRFRGMLASYSHSGGKFRRGTSTSRTDTGNGACETVFVTDFEIVKKANSRWRKLFTVSSIGAILTLIGFLAMFAIAPARRA